MIVAIGFFSLVMGGILLIAVMFHLMLLVINVLTKFSLKKELGRLNAMVICFVYFVGFYEMGRIMLQNYIPVYSLSSYIQ